MAQVGVPEAETHLSPLLRRVAAGEEIVITSEGRPAARLVPVEPGARRDFDLDRGIAVVPDDFDEPLPASIGDAFEG